VKARHDHHGVVDDAVEELVRKPMENEPTSVTVDDRIRMWRFLHPPLRSAELGKKLLAKPLSLALVPCMRLLYLAAASGR
jgi:hypothetical protein